MLREPITEVNVWADGREWLYIWRQRRAISADMIFWKEENNSWLGLQFGAFQIIEAAEYKLNNFLIHFCTLKLAKQIYFPLLTTRRK
jgi:hypothetical protein